MRGGAGAGGGATGEDATGRRGGGATVEDRMWTCDETEDEEPQTCRHDNQGQILLNCDVVVISWTHGYLLEQVGQVRESWGAESQGQGEETGSPLLQKDKMDVQHQLPWR